MLFRSLLDEPASGLDPRSRIELRDLLRSLAADGVAVLVSSHILSELEEIADRVVLVDRGRTAGDHAMADLAAAAARVRWRIRSLDPERLTAALTDALDGRTGLDPAAELPGAVEVGPLTEAEAAGLLAELVAAKVPVSGLAPAGSALESAYLAMTESRR